MFNIRFLASLSEQLIRNPDFMIFQVIRDPNAQALMRILRESSIRAFRSRIAPNEGITDDITETFRKQVIKRYASGSVGSGEWGLVWLKKVLETRSHSTPLLRDGI